MDDRQSPRRPSSRPLPGVLAGAATYAALGTIKVLLSPGLAAASPAGWLIGPFLIFAGGLFWGLLGGALFVLGPVFLVFLRRPRNKLGPAVAISSALFVPLFVFGFRGRIVDGVVLWIAVWLGVRTGLRQLERRAGSA